jgi:hypothetical protein
MMKGAKYYLQRSSGMGSLTFLKYLETMSKFIMDKFVLVICLIQVSRRLILERGVDCYVDFLDEAPSASQINGIHAHYMVHYLVYVRVV